MSAAIKQAARDGKVLTRFRAHSAMNIPGLPESSVDTAAEQKLQAEAAKGDPGDAITIQET